MRLVVEHLRGGRRGERDVFEAPERISFGRHPRSDVALDAAADLDASSRHAEIRREGAVYVLRDIGSSNGTFVGGEPIHELRLQPERAIEVDLGAGGPRLRLFVGEGEPPPLSDPPRGRGRTRERALAALALAIALGLSLWLVL